MPDNPFREKEKSRLAAEAAKREEKRAEATLSLLEKEAERRAIDRESEQEHRRAEEHHWREQIAIVQRQLKLARNLNWITGLYCLFSFLSVLGLIGTIWFAREQIHIDQRAWVAPSDWHTVMTSNGYFYPAMSFKNTGKTFALNTGAYLNSATILDNIPTIDQRHSETNPSVLAPDGSDYISLVDQPLPPLPLRTAPLVEGKYVIFFYGTIWYQDIFSGRWHWMQFCEGLQKDLATYAPCPRGVHQRTDASNE